MLWQSVFAAALIFSMRAMGMLAYYFRDNLDLITEVKEKEYVARKVGEDGRVIPEQTNNAKKASAGVGGVFALYLVVNLISWAVGGPILVPRWLAVILNAIPADGPAPQQADPAAADPAAGGPAAAPQPAALPASLPQPGAAPAATATPATPPPDPGASAPPPTPGAATPPPDPGAAAPPPAPGAAAPPPDPGAAAAPPPP